MSGARIAWAVAWLLAALPAAAQVSEQADPDAMEDADFSDAPPSPWRPMADLQIRSDRVTGLPAGRDDLKRLRSRLRFGASWDRGGALAAGLAAIGEAGSDDNRDNVRNNDNRRSDDADLDQAWLRWRAGERTQLQFGKAALPLALTPMVWDPDLRPIGVSLSHSRQTADFDRWQWNFGAFDVDHPLADGPRLYVAQLGWHGREGAPTALSAVVAYLAFDRLDPLARAGLGRGNPLSAGRYRDGYRLLDLQFALRRNPESGRALEARLDLLRNQSATRARDAARFSVVWGGRGPREWELEYAYQRIQAAAALAAANSDDWWFHAGVRGHMLSAGYAFDSTWSARVSGFSEVRDGLDSSTRRLLLDIEARW